MPFIFIFNYLFLHCFTNENVYENKNRSQNLRCILTETVRPQALELDKITDKNELAVFYGKYSSLCGLRHLRRRIPIVIVITGLRSMLSLGAKVIVTIC